MNLGKERKFWQKVHFLTFIFSDANEIMLSAPDRRKSNCSLSLKSAFTHAYRKHSHFKLNASSTVCKFLDDTREVLSMPFPIFCEMFCSEKCHKMSFTAVFWFDGKSVFFYYFHTIVPRFWHQKKLSGQTSRCMYSLTTHLQWGKGLILKVAESLKQSSMQSCQERLNKYQGSVKGVHGGTR